MAIDTISGHLAGLDLFRGLDARKVELIARAAERLIYRDGQKLCEPGAETDGAIVIIGGNARAVADPDRGRHDDLLLEPGTMLGETAMLTEHRFTTTVQAEGDVRAIKIVRQALRELMQTEPSIADHLHDRLAARLQRMAIELRMIDERLAAASQILHSSVAA